MSLSELEPENDNDPSQLQLYGLPRFPDHGAPIIITRFLGAGQQGEVFQARIMGKIYALKVFQPFFLYNRWDMELAMTEALSPSDAYRFFAPFALECTALARIKSKGLNGKIAAECYGWTKIGHESLNEQVQKLPRDEHAPYFTEDRWAIVKDVVRVDREASPQKMLLAIRDCILQSSMRGIVDADVQPDNYMGNPPVAIDLGSCITKSHPKYSVMHRKIIKQNMQLVQEWAVEDGRFYYSPPPMPSL